ncbi:hypothetical protein CBR_g27796 [Chara braunii]|uniref:Uncharacterized protein n=1 Tax=Chara braunii TaxID=69332 RepID=A0A388L8K1_CHABU|nr:hypothetical protein CBR_g27796 [Chara braunii]|eukprot:GBG78572.1 hypothetical protein CBR_g27796 [Chara braunii]
MAVILKERKEKKELLKQAKLKAIAEEQAAKKKKLEEEMMRLQKEEEKKRRVAEEEEAEEEEALEEGLLRRRTRERGQRSGTKEEHMWMEKKIFEWVANLSLGEDEEAMLYVPQEEKEAVVRELEAIEDPLDRQMLEDEKRLEWKLLLAREKKRRREEANQIQSCKQEVGAQQDIPAKLDKILSYLEILGQAWTKQYQANKGQEHIAPEEQVLMAFHALKDEAVSFARSLARTADCEHNMVAYSRLTPLPTFIKLLRERFTNVTRGVRPSDKLQTIHSRQWKSARALKAVMDDLVAIPDHGVTETQLVNLFYRVMPEPLRGHFFDKTQQANITYDALSREVVLFEAKSMLVSTFWHKDLDKGKKWKGRTISGQVRAKDHLILTLDEGGTDEVLYSQIGCGLAEEDIGVFAVDLRGKDEAGQDDSQSSTMLEQSMLVRGPSAGRKEAWVSSYDVSCNSDLPVE